MAKCSRCGNSGAVSFSVGTGMSRLLCSDCVDKEQTRFMPRERYEPDEYDKGDDFRETMIPRWQR